MSSKIERTVAKKSVILKSSRQQPLDFFFFCTLLLLSAHLLPFLSPSFRASHYINLPGSQCLENNAPIIAQGAWLVPPLLLQSGGIGCCSVLSRQQPDPRTTVQLPVAKSSNDRPPPLKQSQGHTGRERPAKTRALTGTEDKKKKKTIFVFFRSVLRTVIHNNHPI